MGLLATALLLSLDARLLVVPDGESRGVGDVGGGVKIVGGRFRERDERVQGCRVRVRALSVRRRRAHFDLVEWLLAMGLVNYADAERGNHRGWRTLTWGMLPLHASGICACTQHFFGNAATLDWLVAAQRSL